MKLLLAITDGPGVRNFIHGRFLRAVKSARITPVVYSGAPAAALKEMAPEQLDGIEVRELPLYRESRTSHLLRKAAEVAHMKHYDTLAMRLILERGKPRGFSRPALGNHAAHLLAGLCSRPAGIRELAMRHERSVLANPVTRRYREELRELKPDLVFVTHQRPPQSSPLVAAARSLGIPVAAFIFSWDNLSSKGRIPVSYDHYLVWSEHMRSELLRYYPDADPGSVHVVGTPQFEPYAYAEFGWTEARFVEELGLSGGRRRICYTCGDQSTCPKDPDYLAALAEASRAGAFAYPVEIVVRHSPAEESVRFRSIEGRYPELKWAPPRWTQTRANHPEPWSQRIPRAEDIDLLKSTIEYCDINVNVASTMTLDFAQSGKPVVNAGFGEPVAGGGFADSAYYTFEHYRPVLELQAARLARNGRDLIEAINAYLAAPGRDAEGRRRLIEMQIGLPLRGTSERLAETLLSISSVKTQVPCHA